MKMTELRSERSKEKGDETTVWSYSQFKGQRWTPLIAFNVFKTRHVISTSVSLFAHESCDRIASKRFILLGCEPLLLRPEPSFMSPQELQAPRGERMRVNKGSGWK